ncbi:MAG: hypothetical protein M3Q50_07640 [Chloroflexota bacterium]|nr:hypothetical protein [Chloroflexota bacterium]
MSGRGRDEKNWRLEMAAVADSLREMGYDIELPAIEAPETGLVARRDRADRTVLVAIDSGGRFRATLTWVVGEWPSRDVIGGAPVRVIDAVSRTVTITGQLERPEQVIDVVSDLDSIASRE